MLDYILSFAQRLFVGLLKIAAFLVVLIYVLALTLFTSYAYKYRLTVSVRDHGELRSASNVVSVVETRNRLGGGAPSLVCGEALVLPLKNGKVVFALLNGVYRDAVMGQWQWRGSPTGIMLHRLGLETEYSWKDDSGIRRLPQTRTQIDYLKAYEMPEFVTFRNISDPTTIEQVDPEHPERTLGEGVQFENVALEASGDRITKGVVRSALPWMPWLSVRYKYLDGSPSGEAVGRYKIAQFETCNLDYLIQRSVTGG
jgi:hypothetical protein